MLSSKMSLLKPLIASQGGLHLTAYLNNNRNIFHLTKQLRETLETAYEYLAPVIKPDALAKFVAPIQNTLEDRSLLKGFKGNVGLFRNEKTFRILSLPVPVEQTRVVATSFHVKPLLRWMQVDREFLLLGISEGFASLYQGNQESLQLVDTILFPAGLLNSSDSDTYVELKNRRLRKMRYDETLEWLNEWLFSLTQEVTPQLFVAGPKDLTSPFLKACRYANLHRSAIWPSFRQEMAFEIAAEVRRLLKKQVQEHLDQTSLEFFAAESVNLGIQNIFQIAKAVQKGRVKKLIVADGINIFGKIDSQSGGLSIHPTHLDHEDDDLLDDLAQEVIAQGKEVVVASRDEMPKGRPILAILERPEKELSKFDFKQSANEGPLERRAL